MRRSDTEITKKELEQLCNLYMDCKLSVVEERELEMLMSYSSEVSDIISETKAVMGISDRLDLNRHRFNRSNLVISRRFWSYAASLVIAIGCGVGLYIFNNHADPDCIAYVNGNQAPKSEARAVVEHDMEKARSFISKMERLEQEENDKVTEFQNHINSMQ